MLVKIKGGTMTGGNLVVKDSKIYLDAMQKMFENAFPLPYQEIIKKRKDFTLL